MLKVQRHWDVTCYLREHWKTYGRPVCVRPNVQSWFSIMFACADLWLNETWNLMRYIWESDTVKWSTGKLRIGKMAPSPGDDKRWGWVELHPLLHMFSCLWKGTAWVTRRAFVRWEAEYCSMLEEWDVNTVKWIFQERPELNICLLLQTSASNRTRCGINVVKIQIQGMHSAITGVTQLLLYWARCSACCIQSTLYWNNLLIFHWPYLQEPHLKHCSGNG